MFIKIIVLIILAAILLSLGSAVVFLIQQKPGSKNLVKALTLRVTLSIILFFLLILAFALGWIQPHLLLSS